MIAETLAGIALVKSAVDGIKGAITTANDISDIAGHIDNLFAGEKQIQQERAKKAGIKEVYFDRGGYLFHGKVKALAEAVREGGLKI